MRESKRVTLLEICDVFLVLNRNLLDKIRGKQPDEDILKKGEVLDRLKEMYERANAMPVWPFDVKTLIRFFSYTFGPITLVVLNALGQWIVESF
jgi:hypothetical protein